MRITTVGSAVAVPESWYLPLEVVVSHPEWQVAVAAADQRLVVRRPAYWQEQPGQQWRE